MLIKETAIPGCFQIVPESHADDRGVFVKTFQRSLFVAHGIATNFDEEYHSVSRKGVLRGLHFQLPPKEHAKMVWCVQGAALDAVIDLRVGSPTYGQHLLIDLSSENNNVIYIPAGLAHGFYAHVENTVMMYKVTSGYSPEHDTGILWSSVDIPWPENAPTLSRRDRGFIPFSAFHSPFTYEGKVLR